jgi:putative Mn2+ efflux pump MntP
MLIYEKKRMAVGDFEMSQKQFVINNNQMAAIVVDLLGIIFVLVGALIVRAHHPFLGAVSYWIGFVLLIVALIIFVLGMRRLNVQKT